MILAVILKKFRVVRLQIWIKQNISNYFLSGSLERVGTLDVFDQNWLIMCNLRPL